MSTTQDYDERIAKLEDELIRCRHAEDQTASVTNDLNNLLAAMKGQAQLACNDPTGQEKEELVRVVLSSTLAAETVLRRLQARHAPRLLDVAPAPTAAPTDADDGTTRILVADDEENMRKLLARILETSGYEVTLATNGKEAIEIGCSMAFDLAFIDIQLGDMKGTEVFHAMRRARPTTHIIFISGDPGLEQIAKTTGRKPTAFIKKPFDVSEISKRVETILNAKAALARG